MSDPIDINEAKRKRKPPDDEEVEYNVCPFCEQAAFLFRTSGELECTLCNSLFSLEDFYD